MVATIPYLALFPHPPSQELLLGSSPVLSDTCDTGLDHGNHQGKKALSGDKTKDWFDKSVIQDVSIKTI